MAALKDDADENDHWQLDELVRSYSYDHDEEEDLCVQLESTRLVPADQWCRSDDVGFVSCSDAGSESPEDAYAAALPLPTRVDCLLFVGPPKQKTWSSTTCITTALGRHHTRLGARYLRVTSRSSWTRCLWRRKRSRRSGA